MKRKASSYLVGSNRVKRQRTLTSYVKEGAKQTAVAAVKKLLPPQLRSAVTAAQVLKGIASKISRARQTIRPRGRKLFAGYSVGRYGGKFKAVRKKLGSVGKLENMYMSRGYVMKKETQGSIADSTCVYLGAGTYNRDQIVKAVYGAALRKLLQKAGLIVTSADEIPSFQDFRTGGGQPLAGGFYLKLSWTNENGQYLQEREFWGDTVTFGSKASAGIIHDIIRDQLDDDGGYNIKEYGKLGLYEEIGGPFPDRIHSEINLKDEMLNVAVHITFAIQNRTKGAATGANENLDRVDNQPLHGWQYLHNKSLPQVRSNAIHNQLEYASEDGIMLWRADQLPQPLREPPPPRFFTTTIKQSRVRIQPGDIKKTYCSFVYKGSFNHMMTHTLENTFGSTGPGRISGRNILFALEELINSGSSNNIEVVYECTRMTGAYMTTRRRKTMMNGFEEGTQNNLPG